MFLYLLCDIVKGIVVDYMYIVFLGVVFVLFNFWLLKENKDKLYFIGNKVNFFLLDLNWRKYI